MRIALCPEGTRGDVQPLVALGEDLLAKGHEVVLCAPPGFEDFAESRDIEFRPIGTDPKALLERHAKALIRRPGLRQTHAGLRGFREVLVNQFNHLPAATADVDKIIGSGSQMAGPACAELHKLPYEYVVFCPALFRSAEITPFFAWRAGLDAWANRAIWFGHDLVQAPILTRFANRQRKRLSLPPLRDAYTSMLTECPTLAADEELAPLPKDLRHEVRRVGFLHPQSTGGDLPEDVSRFIEAGPPPIYVGFGSMPDPDPTATTNAILDAAVRVKRRVLIGEGWAGLGRSELPRFAKRVGDVSHASLFPHCALVVHHGGAGSTHTAFRARVAQRIVPHLLDQFYWNHRVKAMTGSKIGVVRRHQLRRHLAALIEDGLTRGGPNRRRTF